jgi:hypothetical protein
LGGDNWASEYQKGADEAMAEVCDNFGTRPIVKGGLTIMLFNYQAQ